MNKEPFGDPRKEFLQKHFAEVAPLDSRMKDIGNLPPNEVDSVLEKFETKIFTYENPDAHEESRRILLEASQPATLNAILPLIEKLKRNPRCRGITLVTDNIAGKRFLESGDHGFVQERSPEDPVLSDIDGPFDATIIFEEPRNGPALSLLHGGESVFGAHVYVFISGFFISPDTRERFSSEGRKHMDDFIMLTATEGTKRHISKAMDFPEERIRVVGDPLIDAVRAERGAEYREQARKRWGIDEHTKTLLYSGFPSHDYATMGGDPDINRKTYEETLAGVIKTAEENPSQTFAFVVRNHPRDPQKLTTQDIPTDIPDNLTIILGDDASYQEAVYGADGIACMATSTESFLAPFRGRQAFIFAYGGDSLSKGVLEKTHTHGSTDTLERIDGVTLVDSSEKLAAILPHLKSLTPPATGGKTSIDALAEILLEKHIEKDDREVP